MLAFNLKIAGFLLIALSVAHLYFAKHFDWKNDLAQLSLFNRQAFYVHCFFICLVLAMMGALSLFFTDTLLARSDLARLVCAGLTLFWGIRLFVQWFVYDSALWTGHRLNTFAHACFSLLWIYFTVVFAWAWHSQ